ncbi:MAG: protein translocase subunit SecDF [Bacteroidales bacterium]|nr:protein translocase subunit SecDF [Bacteroidales bacterium]
MQSKGAIKFVAVLLLLASLWQLSFTAVTQYQEKKAEKYADNKAEAAMQTAAFEKVADVDKAFYLDSIRKDESRRYIDSISSEKVYFGYTFKDVRAKSINLGLDLKGGMNVMLQVQLKDLVQALAGGNNTPEFTNALALAQERSVNSRQDFITLFAEAWKETANGTPLAQVFGTYEMRDKINPESTDEQVIEVIRGEAESAISNSFNVLRNRIDRFGVTQPNIQKLGNSGRILVELPGVKEPERVRKLLQGTASLEFWATYDNAEVEVYLNEANAKLAELLADTDVAQVEEVAAKGDDLLAEEIQKNQEDAVAEAEFKKQNPLFSVLQPSGAKGNACIGYANYADTALVNKYLSMPQIKALFPREFKPMWTVKASQWIPGDNIYELVAIKSTSRDGKATLDGGVVTDARVQYGNTGGNPEVSMSMNAEGANTWARMTKENIGKQIAIVLDGMVYSYPTVQSEIAGGSSQITGNFTLEEAEDLANVLKSGKLPAPATIIQEQVVGPSLGAESINAGLISFVIAFVLVLLYMILFYQGAGLVADVALLCNVVLLFGTLVSFGAVLTLPGIAGLVLTLGMAVDANVIIYERVKEELRAGKGLSKAIADGYSNAYSAIIDGQITTLLTGIVLFIFGSGPVQGFATTLIIGIVTSVLTSIFITRIIFDDRVSKGKNITFDNKLTRNFLQNTHVDFIGKKKIAYIVSGVLILASVVSIFTKGFTYGVDFTGGRTYVVRFDQPVTAEDVRAAALAEFDGAVEVKQFGGESQMKITTQYLVENESTEADAEVENKLYNALKGFFAAELSFAEFTSTLDNPNGIISSDKVGPTIANDITRDAIIAVIIALIVIFAYIAVRFRGWTWGLGGVTGLAHTSIIVIGFFSIFSGILPFSLDIDQTFIAAILTIIGYAINDTVVIFDRIREYKELHPKADFRKNVNEALNSTLSRTMNTSLTTLITMLAIAIFGGEVIRGLAVALILGIVVGTYASVFIATPIMYDVTKKAVAKKEEK